MARLERLVDLGCWGGEARYSHVLRRSSYPCVGIAAVQDRAGAGIHSL